MSRTLVVVLITLAIGGAIAGYEAQAQDPAPKACMAVQTPWALKKDIDSDIAEGKFVTIPAGWTPVGATSLGSVTFVMICR